jgi:uncharacterized sulfatase
MHGLVVYLSTHHENEVMKLQFPVVLMLLLHSVASAELRKPNILFVLIDDMGYRDLSCFGGTRVKTPQLDRLAKEGMRFNQFYVNAPICSPSRVAFLTGQYPNRWHITSYLDTRQLDRRRGIADWLSPDAPSIARLLHDAGYYTAHVGKWHMGGQRDVGDAPAITQYGFDSSITNFEGLGPRILPKFDPQPDGTPFHHVPTEMSAKLGGEIHWVERHQVTGAFVDHAIQQIRIAAQRNQPFYINLWPDDVHSPCQAPPGMRGDGSTSANYCGVLAEADRQFGRIFDCIRTDPALRDNTLILVCSDNGHEVNYGSGGELRGSKGQLYEGGIHSPLIAWFPGRMSSGPIGSSNDRTTIAAMDFAPSLLSLAGINPPKEIHFDGMNFGQALIGKDQPTRDQPIMWVRPPDRPGPKNRLPDLAVRDGQWKLLVHRDGSDVQLFHITDDPTEAHDVAAEHPDIADRLKRQVIEWDRAIGQ